MIFLPAIYYLVSHGTRALSIQDLDKSAQSCRDLGDCRTIWDIIWSCIVIIFSCTWLAIHPNIASQEEGKGWRFLRRVGMLISAVIMPELMIWWAMRQWWAAYELKRKYKKFNWTLTHGFFAIMGGFMLCKSTPQHILDPWELEQYLQSGQIDITEAEIQDKSKGDILTKGFVVLQMTWFIIQLIARGVGHLPVTELEIATLAFACLNFITYGVWWNKPLNVESPVRVYSHMKHHRPSINDVTEESSDEGEIRDGDINSESLNLVGNNTLSGKEVNEGGANMNGSTVTGQKRLHTSRFFKLDDLLKNIHDAFQPPVDTFPAELWHKANNILWQLLFPFMLMVTPGGDPNLELGGKRVPTFYNGRIGDVRKNAHVILLIPVTLVTVLFGGIHCIAWGFPFPTHAEQLIWRVSSTFITAAPMATFLTMLYVHRAARSLFGPSDSVDFFFKIPGIITLVLYPLARVILLVQALMTLRLLPPDAYATIRWTTFIPHI